MSDTPDHSGPESEEAPKIEFPCEYPIKTMGTSGDELYQTVVAVMEKHAPGFDHATITTRDSAKGNYQSITVTITATGVDQLEAIFNDLKNSSAVKMVL